jgi:cytochrome c553
LKIHHQQFRNRPFIAMLALATFGIMQATPSHAQGSRLYAPCAACHSPNAWGSMDGAIPNLAGQHYPYLKVQIDVAAALHGDLAPPEMTGALRGMPTQEKDALADYISRLGNSDVLLDSNRPIADRRWGSKDK